MQRSVRLDDCDYAQSIDREIENIRASLGRSSKLHDLFEFLVERSRSGVPPREIEIAQDVFGRTAGNGDDGGARVYIHRLRKRLDEAYSGRADADLRIALPLGEYRLVAEIGRETAAEAPAPTPEMSAPAARRMWVRPLALGIVLGGLISLLLAWLLLFGGAPGAHEAARARRSTVWAPFFANGKNVVIAEGDAYLFEEKGVDGRAPRLLRDFSIRSREDLDTYLLSHPHDAGHYDDSGQSYVPTTVPRAQQYLSPILSAAPSVRVLPASQLPAAAMMSLNIVYLGLPSGLGPLLAPVTTASRFEPDGAGDGIRDKRTGQVFGAGRPNETSPRRQYGLVSLFLGKEGNRYVVLAGTSEMGLVGLVETMADPKRLQELSAATRSSATAEALYEVDSQGAGVLATRLIASNIRDSRIVWAP